MPIQSLVNITEAAAQLKEPFTTQELAQTDELSLAVFVCMGAIAWHRHLDEDELFLVQSGLITLESEWGAVTLAPWELALMPKGVGHRSLSVKWSSVLLLRPRLLIDRKNGHRRLYGMASEERLRKTNIVTALPELLPLYQPFLLAKVDDFCLWAMRCFGTSLWEKQEASAGLLIGQAGTVLVETDEGQAAPLGTSELVTLSRGTRYRISAGQPAVILQVGREPAGH